MAARGAFRTTKDVDLLVDWPLQEGTSLAGALTERGIRATFRRGDFFEDTLGGLVRALVPTSGASIQCDILFPSRAWERAAVTRATRAALEGFSVPVAQADDLFLLKLKAGGPQDLLDAGALFRVQTPDAQRTWEEAASKHRLTGAYKRSMKFLKDTE